MRIAQLTLGGVLILLAPAVIPLPGPAGIFLFAGGLILILRNSRLARRHFARAKRRWPRMGRIIDRAMRRRSTLRRIALEKRRAAASPPRAPCPAVRPR
ncbi:hypothetical protein [Sphingomonas abaci]|uniref:Transmembrane protein (PGPGW) n=1 Tax=Sphingomonas abaci TaxID=237611 RepID=A0A7W7EX53_9SPHN|nr:hypothetical protein [Sphingomonas abaci]MBB4616756.1 hypothetical protein [Sphingomonas abaci]